MKQVLLKIGLELLDETKSVLVERIKIIVIGIIQHAEEWPKHKISVYLSKQLNHNYTYLANQFKEVTGTTIQHYILIQKIEKVKELILYNEINLNEISYNLHYSSVAHLSNQFKKLTGLTPTYFKKFHIYKKDSCLSVFSNRKVRIQ